MAGYLGAFISCRDAVGKRENIYVNSVDERCLRACYAAPLKGKICEWILKRSFIDFFFSFWNDFKKIVTFVALWTY